MAQNMQTPDPAAMGASQMAPAQGSAAPPAAGTAALAKSITLQAGPDGMWSVTIDGQPAGQPMTAQDAADTVEEAMGVDDGDESEGGGDAQSMWDQEAQKGQQARSMQGGY